MKKARTKDQQLLEIPLSRPVRPQNITARSGRHVHGLRSMADTDGQRKEIFIPWPQRLNPLHPHLFGGIVPERDAVTRHFLVRCRSREDEIVEMKADQSPSRDLKGTFRRPLEQRQRRLGGLVWQKGGELFPPTGQPPQPLTAPDEGPARSFLSAARSAIPAKASEFSRPERREE